MSVRRTVDGPPALLGATSEESLRGAAFVPDAATTLYRPGVVLAEATPPSIEECVGHLKEQERRLPPARKAALLAGAVATPLPTTAPRSSFHVPNVRPDDSVEGLRQADIAAESARRGAATAADLRREVRERDTALAAARQRAHAAEVAAAKVVSLRGSEPRPDVAAFIASNDAFKVVAPTTYEVTLAMQTAGKNAAAHRSLLTNDKKKVPRCPFYPVEKHFDDPAVANMKKKPLTDVERWANRLGLPPPPPRAAPDSEALAEP